jgi:hypothetical protein
MTGMLSCCASGSADRVHCNPENMDKFKLFTYSYSVVECERNEGARYKKVSKV